MDNVAGTDSRPPGMKVGAVFSAAVGEQKGVFGIKFFFHMSSFFFVVGGHCLAEPDALRLCRAFSGQAAAL